MAWFFDSVAREDTMHAPLKYRGYFKAGDPVVLLRAMNEPATVKGSCPTHVYVQLASGGRVCVPNDSTVIRHA